MHTLMHYSGILTMVHRHPDPHLRPSFDDVIMILGDDSTILNIPEDALTSHPQAGVLGAPLEAGHNMYYSMQKTYLK